MFFVRLITLVLLVSIVLDTGRILDKLSPASLAGVCRPLVP